jgi:Fe-S-cluster containining protein
MKLDVLPNTDPKSPWYAGGLKFACSQCGNCCTGGPGYVWLEKGEILKLAEHLRLTPEETVERYCRKIDGKFSLRERKNPTTGQYDCIFLQEEQVTRPAGRAQDGGVGGADEAVVNARRTCAVYPVRPLQCRTWPFWPENLSNPKIWQLAAKRCHGMNSGRPFTVEQIHAIRDAAEWPKDPPTSAPQKARKSK